jgi:ABC-type sugar transport system permease subunit
MKKKKSKLKNRESLAGYVFTAPWLIGAVLFVIIPLFQSFYYALCNIKLKPTGREFKFIGSQNFTDIFLKDISFIQTLLGYLIETLLSVPVIVVFSLIIAMLLNGRIKGKGIFRTIYFLPVIVVSGPVMSQLAEQGAASIPAMNTTMITEILTNVLPNYLADPIAGLFGNMIMILWYSGVQILIFIAAIQKINPSLYEAAKIDGGSGWECFWKITLPTIKPMILLNAIYTVIFMSNNDQNAVIGLISDNMFAANRGYGFASAMAWMYSIIETLMIVFVFFLLKPKKDNYLTTMKADKKRAAQKAKELDKLKKRQIRNSKKKVRA